MQTVEIIIFAMIAAFVALRLFSVLGRRPDEDSNPSPLGQGAGSPASTGDDDSHQVRDPFVGVDDDQVRATLERISKADRNFDYPGFKEGALAAYEMILEGFWKGERSSYEPYVSKDIAADFNGALEQREADGLVVQNRLVDLDTAEAIDAQLDGKSAEITMAFSASIVAVTRDAQGELVDGSLSDTYQTRDLWTFARKVGSKDPNWVVIATESQDAGSEEEGG